MKIFVKLYRRKKVGKNLQCDILFLVSIRGCLQFQWKQKNVSAAILRPRHRMLIAWRHGFYLSNDTPGSRLSLNSNTSSNHVKEIFWSKFCGDLSKYCHVLRFSIGRNMLVNIIIENTFHTSRLKVIKGYIDCSQCYSIFFETFIKYLRYFIIIK